MTIFAHKAGSVAPRQRQPSRHCAAGGERGRGGPPQAFVTFAGTVLWALAAVIVNRYDVSAVTTGAAVVSAVLVASTLFGTLRWGRAAEAT